MKKFLIPIFTTITFAQTFDYRNIIIETPVEKVPVKPGAFKKGWTFLTMEEKVALAKKCKEELEAVLERKF